MTATIGKTGLLVSVRSAEEAAVALTGGADIIDVKEPSRGALGRADDEVISEVVRLVAGRRPVSAALGEIAATDHFSTHAKWSMRSTLAFVKWGLANARGKPWREFLRADIERLSPLRVVVAYADADQCLAPSLTEVLDFVCAEGKVLLVDTFEKKGRSLLHWLSLSRLSDLVRRCHEANVRVALAGSLGLAEIEKVLAAKPDWIGVRGAACSGRDRQAAVHESNVRRLASAIHVG